MFVEQLTQALAPYDYTPPQSVNNATISTNGLDLGKFKRAIWYVQLGSAGAAGIVAIVPQSAPTSAFSTIHNMTGFSITNMNTTNTVVSVEVRSDQVTQQNSGDEWVRLNIVGSGNAVTVGALGLGGEAIQKPGGTSPNTSIVKGQYVCST